MQKKKSTLVYRTDLVNIGLGQGQKETVPYLSGKTEFDTEGRPVMQSAYSAEGVLSEKVIMQYDENGRVIHQTYWVDEGDPSEEKSFEYDNSGKVVKELYHYLDGSFDTTFYTYNEDGLLVEKTTIDEEETPERKEVFTYENGKLKSMVITDTEGNKLAKEELGYDDKGNLIQHIKEDFETGEYFKLMVEFSADNHKISEKIYDEEDELLETTWFEEDDKGRIIRTVEENAMFRKIKNFSFDDRGNNLGYEETNANGEKMVMVEHQYDNENNTISSMVFVNGGGRTLSQHYELSYEYEWY